MLSYSFSTLVCLLVIVCVKFYVSKNCIFEDWKASYKRAWTAHSMLRFDLPAAAVVITTFIKDYLEKYTYFRFMWICFVSFFFHLYVYWLKLSSVHGRNIVSFSLPSHCIFVIVFFLCSGSEKETSLMRDKWVITKISAGHMFYFARACG